MSKKIIAAVSQNGVIGLDNKIPWNYPEDFKWFKQATFNSTIIMGRHTHQSICKALPKRRNIVISKTIKEQTLDNIEYVHSINRSLELCSPLTSDIWFIGGANIYREAMKYADEIYLTLIPQVIENKNVVFFPWIDPSQFQVSSIKSIHDYVENIEYKSDLKIALYKRIK